MKVSILGQKYIIRKLTDSEYPKLGKLEANGLAELYSKELIINSEMNPKSGQEYANFDDFEKKVIRHEIIHAFFHEAGLMDYCSDETLVDWLALQMPKIKKAMKDTNCI